MGRAGTAGTHQAPASILPSTSEGVQHGTVIDRLSTIHHGRLGKLLNQLQVCLHCKSRSEGGRKIYEALACSASAISLNDNSNRSFLCRSLVWIRYTSTGSKASSLRLLGMTAVRNSACCSRPSINLYATNRSAETSRLPWDHKLMSSNHRTSKGWLVLHHSLDCVTSVNEEENFADSMYILQAVQAKTVTTYHPDSRLDAMQHGNWQAKDSYDLASEGPKQRTPVFSQGDLAKTMVHGG